MESEESSISITSMVIINDESSSDLPNTIHPWSFVIGLVSGISFSLIVLLMVIGGMWLSNCTRIIRYKRKTMNYRGGFEEEMQTAPENDDVIRSAFPLAPGSSVYLSEVEGIDTEEFQQTWENISEYKSEKFKYEDEISNASDVIQSHLSKRLITCIASGSSNNQTKLYCYAKDLKLNISFLLEIVIHQNRNAKLIVKSDQNLYLNPFIDYFFDSLGPLCTRHSLPQSHS